MKFCLQYLLYCYIVSSVYSLSPIQKAQIATVIQTDFMEPNFTPGTAFSVFYQDDVYATGFGLKDIKQDWKVDNETLFGIASMTKSFTSTVVVKVLQEHFPGLGVAALDRPISKLIPNFNFTMSDRYRSEALSFRDLLSHRTCLEALYLGRTFGAIRDASEFAYRTRFVKEACPFRTGFVYNNGMFGLAGEAIAALANSTFADLVESLLREIGMNDTILLKPSLNFDNLPQASRGYYRSGGQTIMINSELFKRMHVTLPSGGIMTSSRDMAKYMEFHLNYGKINGVQVVPAALMKKLHKVSNILDVDMTGVEGDYAYGLGLFLGIHKRWPLVSHTGSWPPFTSRMSFFPTLNLGIYTAVNGPGVLNVDHKIVHDKVFNIVTDGMGTHNFLFMSQGFNETCVPCQTKNLLTFKTKARKHNNVNVKPEDIQGLYGSPVQGEFTVTFNRSNPVGQLYLHYGIWGTGYLRKLRNSNSLYYPEWDSDIIGDFLSEYTQMPVTTIDFGNPKVAIMDFDGYTFRFVRNGTLNTFPTPPWSPGSCSPSSDSENLSSRAFRVGLKIREFLGQLASPLLYIFSF